MLGKLFRHDMRALSKTLRWVVLGVVALALLASLVTAIELRMSVNNYADFLQNTQLYAMFGMTQMLTVIGVAASGLLALVPFAADPLLDAGVEALDSVSAGAFLGSLLAELHFCGRAPAEAEHGLYELHAPANFPQDARILPLAADARANCLDLSALSLQECLQSPAVGAVCAAKERVCLLIDRTDPSQKTLYWK